MLTPRGPVAFAACIMSFFVATSSVATSAYGAEATTAAPQKYANPDISANFLFRYQHSTAGKNPVTPEANGFGLQETELQFTSDVDPYFKASALFSIKREDPTKEFGVEPEEVYLETLSLPAVTFRAGIFKAAFGRHNQLHTHAYPFIDAPLIHRALFGDEGLSDAGLSAATLIPVPWFMELTLQGLAGGSPTLYNSGNPDNLAAVARLRDLWDLSDAMTLDLGLSATGGANSWGGTSGVFGPDLTFKWRPSEGGKYTSFSWTAEYLESHLGLNPKGEKLGGLATWVQYQVTERWWAQARYDYLGVPQQGSEPRTQRQSLLVGFFPSEFSGIRAQLDRTTPEGADPEFKVALQWNISIGAHPAHAY